MRYDSINHPKSSHSWLETLAAISMGMVVLTICFLSIISEDRAPSAASSIIMAQAGAE